MTKHVYAIVVPHAAAAVAGGTRWHRARVAIKNRILAGLVTLSPSRGEPDLVALGLRQYESTAVPTDALAKEAGRHGF